MTVHYVLVNETPTLFTLRSHMTSPCHVLMKTSSKQLKCCDLHHTNVVTYAEAAQKKTMSTPRETNLHLDDHDLQPCFNVHVLTSFYHS